MPFPGIFPPPLPCDAPPEAVATELHAALEAYGRAVPDLATFYASAARAEGKVGCLQAPLPTAAAAELYEVQAILAYVQKDAETATAFLRAAHAAGGALPEQITKNTPRLAEIERAAIPGTNGSHPLVAPAGTTLLVDGAPALAAPTDRPYLLQVQWSDGQVHWTGLIPQDTSPDLARLAPPPPPPPDCPACVSTPCPTLEPIRVSPPPAWLTAGALGSTVVAAGLYGMGVHTMHTFYDPETSIDDLAGLQRRSATLTWASAGVGALALGLDVTWGVTLAKRF